MYRRHEYKHKQLTLYTHFFNITTDIDMKNHWVVLSNMVPWLKIEEKYQSLFVEGGKPAYSIRMALGSLIIKEKLNLTDKETVAQISENPYLQYFLGYDQFIAKTPFDASSLTHFRKRFTPEVMADINEMIITAQEDKNDDDQPKPPSESGMEETPEEPEGDLILDATCTPADIHYPTDITLLNDAREILETVIDTLHEPFVGIRKKPRDYRQRARRDFLTFIKARKPRVQKIRKAIRKQLGYVGRDLGIIEEMLEYGELASLPATLYRKLLVVSELYLSIRKLKTHQIAE